MLICVWQYWSMLVNVDGVDQCSSVLTSVDPCWSMLIIAGQYRSVLFNVGGDERWSRLVTVNQWWKMLVNVDLCCLMLTNIDQCCSEQQNHWKIIDCSLVFKVFDVCGGWKVMKIDRIKEKAAQNLRKSSSEARISRNSCVGDVPNSPGRRERESWDGVLVLPGLPIIIEGMAALVLSGLRGCPKILDLRPKITIKYLST